MKVLSAAAEIYPLVKTGGLADVVGALPAALAGQGVDMRCLVPGYRPVMAALDGITVLHRYADLFGGPASLVAGKAGGLDLIAIDAPHLYDRPGNPYLGPDGKDWPDNAQRFAALSRAAAEVARGIIPGYQPDVLHLPRLAGSSRSRLCEVPWRTEDAAHRPQHRLPGTVPRLDLRARFGFPPPAFAIDGVEYYGSVGFLKGGLATANAISTVSPTYAQEICTPDYGMGLDGLLRARHAVLSGIVNGIDADGLEPGR